MINCREVAELLSSGHLSGSPLRTRLAVRLHLSMCRFCRRFAAQLAWMGKASRQLVHDIERSKTVEGLENRVLKRLGLPERE